MVMVERRYLRSGRKPGGTRIKRQGSRIDVRKQDHEEAHRFHDAQFQSGTRLSSVWIVRVCDDFVEAIRKPARFPVIRGF
jgi:hypothetical protein